MDFGRTRSSAVVQQIPVLFVWATLGSLLWGCGDPALQNSNSRKAVTIPAEKVEQKNGAKAKKTETQKTGLRHSTGDDDHQVRVRNTSEASASLTSLSGEESLAECDKSNYQGMSTERAKEKDEACLAASEQKID